MMCDGSTARNVVAAVPRLICASPQCVVPYMECFSTLKPDWSTLSCGCWVRYVSEGNIKAAAFMIFRFQSQCKRFVDQCLDTPLRTVGC